MQCNAQHQTDLETWHCQSSSDLNLPQRHRPMYYSNLHQIIYQFSPYSFYSSGPTGGPRGPGNLMPPTEGPPRRGPGNLKPPTSGPGIDPGTGFCRQGEYFNQNTQQCEIDNCPQGLRFNGLRCVAIVNPPQGTRAPVDGRWLWFFSSWFGIGTFKPFGLCIQSTPTPMTGTTALLIAFESSPISLHLPPRFGRWMIRMRVVYAS